MQHRSCLTLAMWLVWAILVLVKAGGAISLSGGGIRRDVLLGLSHGPSEHPGCSGILRARELLSRSKHDKSCLLRLKGGENFLDRLDRAVTSYVFGCFTPAVDDMPSAENISVPTLRKTANSTKTVGAEEEVEDEEETGGYLDRLDARVTSYVFSFFASSKKGSPDKAAAVVAPVVEEEAFTEGWWLDRLDARVTNYAYSFFFSKKEKAGASAANPASTENVSQTEEIKDGAGMETAGSRDHVSNATQHATLREINDPLAEMLLKQARAMQVGTKPTTPAPKGAVAGPPERPKQVTTICVREQSILGNDIAGQMQQPSDEHSRSSVSHRSDSPSHKSIDFTFQTDFDENGVLYFLGTEGGRAQTWSNPAEKGLVSVAMAPQPAFSGNKNGAISRSKQRLRSKQRRNPWLAIDLGPSRKLALNKYSLRHGGHANEGPLRNWEFQGSNDGDKWETLRVHVNDESLKGGYGVASWDVETGETFRHFRVFDVTAAPVQLSIGGLELYGRLELSYPSAASPRSIPPPPPTA